MSFRLLYSRFPRLIQSQPAGGSDDKQVPPLDKLPTNEFIERFLEEDDSDGITGPDRQFSLDGIPVTGEIPGRAASARNREATLSAQARHLEDRDDVDTLLDIREKYPPYDDTGHRAYVLACERFGAMPSATLCEKLKSSASVDMSHYGTGPAGAKAMAIPMVINTTVTSVNLRGNDMGKEGVSWIGKMMAENDYITELNLAENNLRSHGAKVIAQMLQNNQNVRILDISDNNFSDLDAKLLAKPIEDHPSLRSLNLSNNNFGELAGTAFKSTISENSVLSELDLSWNHIRGKGAEDLAKGLKDNVGLKVVNLSWNGFGDAGARELGLALKTCSLTELDLSSNRIFANGFMALVKALKDNDDLKILKLAKNPIPEDAALAALEMLHKMDDLNLTFLDLADLMYNSRVFKDKYTELKEKHTSFEAQWGYTDSYGKRRLRRYNVVEEALNAMRRYCVQHNMNIVELFARFDADGSMSVTHDEFKQGLREARIPLTDYHIDELIRTLDQDGDGEIDFSEMVLGAEMYKGDDE